MAFSAYLAVDGVPGECQEEGHADTIKIYSFHWGVSQGISSPGGTGGRTGGRASFSDFSVVKDVDIASTPLLLKGCTGENIPKVELQVVQATGDQNTYLKYTFENVVVSGYRPGGSAQGGDKPLEEVSFNFGKVTQEYTPIGEDGKPGSPKPGGWDLALNKKI